MNEVKTRYDEMQRQASEYHKKYPLVWRWFVRYTVQLIDKGFKHYGAKSIFERIRWETDIPDVTGKSTFKINNNYTSFYARRFVKFYPEHKDFFLFREQISKSKQATGHNELTPEDYKYL